MGLSLDTFKTQEVTVVRCRGRIVFGKEADELRRILLSLLNESKRIVLDLGWVAYVDSAGLGTLVASFISARHHGAEIKFANPSPMTWKLLRTTNVDRLFEIHGSTDEAIHAFSNYPKAATG